MLLITFSKPTFLKVSSLFLMMLKKTLIQKLFSLMKTLSLWVSATSHLTVLLTEWSTFLQIIFMQLTEIVRLYKLVIQKS